MTADSEEYRRRIYRDYAASIDPRLRGAGLPSLRANDETFERFYRPLLPADRGARIFDAGCGRGGFLSFLQERGWTNAAGVDRSPESVAGARAAGVSGVEEGDVVVHLAAHPGAYDCIVAINMLEHMHKHEVLAFLDAAFAALKPGGLFLAQTVNAESPFFGRMLHIDFTHETAFTRHSLHQVLGAAGFADAEFVELISCGSGPRGWLRRALWALFRFKASLYLHAETGSGALNNDHLFGQIFLASARKPA